MYLSKKKIYKQQEISRLEGVQYCNNSLRVIYFFIFWYQYNFFWETFSGCLNRANKEIAVHCWKCQACWFMLGWKSCDFGCLLFAVTGLLWNRNHYAIISVSKYVSK